jgi:hypothetical protein
MNIASAFGRKCEAATRLGPRGSFLANNRVWSLGVKLCLEYYIF